MIMRVRPRQDLRIPTTHIQYCRILRAGNRAPHLNVPNTMIHAYQGQVPKQRDRPRSQRGGL